MSNIKTSQSFLRVSRLVFNTFQFSICNRRWQMNTLKGEPGQKAWMSINSSRLLENQRTHYWSWPNHSSSEDTGHSSWKKHFWKRTKDSVHTGDCPLRQQHAEQLHHVLTRHMPCWSDSASTVLSQHSSTFRTKRQEGESEKVSRVTSSWLQSDSILFQDLGGQDRSLSLSLPFKWKIFF